jgi:AraC-like DNA-binding protein
MPQIFETSDPDLASEAFREQYTSMRMRIRSRPPYLRLASTQVGRARLDRATFRMTLDGSADPLEAVGVIRVRGGTVRYSWGDSEATYGPGDTCFPLPPGRRWATSLQDVDSEVIMLDPALLDEAAGVQPGAGTPVRLLSSRPRSEQAAAQLWRAAEAVRVIISAQPDSEPHPLVINSADRLLAASVLAAFPNTAFPEPTIEDRRDAHPAALRRAISFIDENAHTDITMGDIAAAAFVTVRAVQLAFRRHLECTPMEYLRRVRLAHAHRELRAADPAGETVTAVAYRWGFPSTSRFTSYYRQAYGVLPSRTLHQ